jgi:nucleoside-diphosphate-sugar epimerase
VLEVEGIVRVLVTGGTGMIGCHTAAALVAAGHEVRLLVRNPARIAPALGPLGIEDPEYAVGDVTDEDCVARALEGCDAVLHSAAFLSFDRSCEAEMQQTNVEGTRNVLGRAVSLGLDPIVHVSSIAALFPPDGKQMTVHDNVKDPRDQYARTKAQAERYARELQATGAPVTITYPGSTFGPHDPTVNEAVRGLFDMLKIGFFLIPPTGSCFVDVRDVAAVHVALMEPGKGLRRFMIGGWFLLHSELVDTYVRLTGRRVIQISTPARVMLTLGWAADLLRGGLGVDVGMLSYESMLFASNGVPCDSAAVQRDLGVEFRPADDTMRDTLLWMYEQGLMEREHLGKLAP